MLLEQAAGMMHAAVPAGGGNYFIFLVLWELLFCWMLIFLSVSVWSSLEQWCLFQKKT
jgi:hypothetical protein